MQHIVACTWHCWDTHDINKRSSDLLERFGVAWVVNRLPLSLYLFTCNDWDFDFLTWDDLVGRWTLAQFVSLYVTTLSKNQFISFEFCVNIFPDYFCVFQTVSCSFSSDSLAAYWLFWWVTFYCRVLGSYSSSYLCKVRQRTGCTLV